MTAANFPACLKVTLRYEGGYVDDPRDPGGETNFGITKTTATANGYNGSMRAIPMPIVEHIYYNKYWHSGSGNCDTLATGVDMATFDFAVHSGPARPWKYLKAIASRDPQILIKKLCALRLSFLQGLKIWATYSKGFTSRVANVEAVSTKMALQTTTAPAPIIVKKLKDTSKKAEQTASNHGKAAGTVGTGGAAGTGGTAAQVDVTQFDWTAWLLVGGIGLVVIFVVLFFVWKWHVNKQRAVAFATVAQEV